jgi:hypothetical protein
MRIETAGNGQRWMESFVLVPGESRFTCWFSSDQEIVFVRSVYKKKKVPQ